MTGERADQTQTVAQTSEEELLRQIFPLLPPGRATIVPPGDDAAVVAAPDGRFVVSTDVLVEDRHFRRRWSSGEDVGRRAAAQNLADVAAMGARPTALVVSLVTPADLPVEWVLGVARGLAAGCGPVGAAVVGGDLSSGPVVVVSVTVHGTLEGRAPVLRSGARAGDVLAYAGVRGRSAAGLALLEAGVVGPGDARTAGYLRPEPPLAAGPVAADAGATAMLDVSDGLLRDAARIARASDVAIDLRYGAFDADVAALQPAARDLTLIAQTDADAAGVASRTDALVRDWILAGGEDHGLLATFPEGAVPAPFVEVGRVTAGEGVTVDGLPPGGSATGWDHYGGR
ncbi:thiamine-phosphate kinase [Paraoerskovia marina]|uniref:thiamine-phosphate kinase n=1 Tax=Paraoerskovia marina TaxID=545619 RepID=UPI0009DCE384|nr:thiamine-phosphate kinase [Paraoerskovia marina]